MDASPACPITQEEIRQPIELRGVRFELEGVLELLRVQGHEAKHPYDRTPFTDTELRHIHGQALLLGAPALVENGWTQESSFMRQFHYHHRRQAEASTICRCTITDLRVCAVMCAYLLLILWLVSWEQL